MRESKIPWLADASDRLRLLLIEIDAALRRLAWGEELSDEHISAFINAVCEAYRINADVIKHLSQARQRRAYADSKGRITDSLEAIQRMAARNGNGRINGAG